MQYWKTIINGFVTASTINADGEGNIAKADSYMVFILKSCLVLCISISQAPFLNFVISSSILPF